MKTKHHPAPSRPAAQSGHRAQTKAIRRRPSALTFAGFLFISLFALPVPLAEAQCQQWDVSGNWTLRQGTLRVPVVLRQNGKVISGSAQFRSVIKGGTTFLGTGRSGSNSLVRGSVDGTVLGDRFAAEVVWDNGTTGVYNGAILPSGKIEGLGYNKASPSVKVSWYGDTKMVCANAAGTNTAPPAVEESADASGMSLWIGRWDTKTDQGGHFELIFSRYGDKLKGTIRDLNGNSQYNGRLFGTLSGRRLTYDCTQSGIDTTSHGFFQINAAGSKITGSGVVNDTEKTGFSWGGSKVQ